MVLHCATLSIIGTWPCIILYVGLGVKKRLWPNHVLVGPTGGVGSTGATSGKQRMYLKHQDKNSNSVSCLMADSSAEYSLQPSVTWWCEWWWYSRSKSQHFKAATLHFLDAEGLFRLSCVLVLPRVLCLKRYWSRKSRLAWKDLTFWGFKSNRHNVVDILCCLGLNSIFFSHSAYFGLSLALGHS